MTGKAVSQYGRTRDSAQIPFLSERDRRRMARPHLMNIHQFQCTSVILAVPRSLVEVPGLPGPRHHVSFPAINHHRLLSYPCGYL